MCSPPLHVFRVYVFTRQTKQAIAHHKPFFPHELKNDSSLMATVRTRKVDCPIHGQRLGPTNLAAGTQESRWELHSSHSDIHRIICHAKRIITHILYYWILKPCRTKIVALVVEESHFSSIRVDLDDFNPLDPVFRSAHPKNLQFPMITPNLKHVRMNFQICAGSGGHTVSLD